MTIREAKAKLEDLKMDMLPLIMYGEIEPKKDLRKLLSHYDNIVEIIKSMEKFIANNYSEEEMNKNPSIYIFNDTDGGFDRIDHDLKTNKICGSQPACKDCPHLFVECCEIYKEVRKHATN